MQHGSSSADTLPGSRLLQILEGFDAAKKIGVIKEVRAVTGLGLKEAKVRHPPSIRPQTSLGSRMPR